MTMLQAMWLMLMSYLISSSMTPSQKPAQPTAFEDIDFPQAKEGTPQAVWFGDCWSGDWMVLAVGDYRVATVTAGEAGKK